MDLESDIQFLKGVGPKMAENLKRLEIKRPIDLIRHYPRTYIDYQHPQSIRSLRIGELAVVSGEIVNLTIKRTSRKWVSIIEFNVNDGTGMIKIVFFNQPYLGNHFIEGQKMSFYGRVSFDFSNKIKLMSSPQFSNQNLIIPIYPETRNITSKYLSKLINHSLKLIKPGDFEFLPPEIIELANLSSAELALDQIHQPKSIAEINSAKKRLVFEELYLLSLRAQMFRQQLKKENGFSIKIADTDLVKFTKKLHFTLTTAQKKAAWQIICDLRKNQPMNRLLNGDVGSGKTIVAAMAAYSVYRAGYGVVMIAPTEILAQQHFKTLKSVLEPFGMKINLITANKKEKTEKVDLTIGTHALLFDKGQSNIALVIIDEQHRFGVMQRKSLHTQYKADNRLPHLLSMTATPIPRTLQLTLYGDLDVSLIDEMPKGRKKIITKVFTPRNESAAYDLVRREIQKGYRIFVVCPLIERSKDSENLFDLDKKSVLAEYDRLRKTVFPEFSIGLLHGRLKTKEKDQVMTDFKEGKINILVSTSVVEVGVDIPEATVMLIEDAECFGLAQLHQFRGRVGRSQYQSYCLLKTSNLAPKVLQRLAELAENESGFKLAEIDLKNRGPGQIFGQEQSGHSDLRLDWISDIFIIEKARSLAKKTLKLYPDLSKLPKLNLKLNENSSPIHLE